MKLKGYKFESDFVALSFEAENDAEQHQAQALLTFLKSQNADVTEWNNMEGNNGFTVRIRCVATT